MPNPVTDYLIDHAAVDWDRALAPWSWLLPHEFTLWLVNRFADPFLVTDDDAVLMLDAGAGTLTRLAASRDEFCHAIDQPGRASEWLMIPLVDRMTAAGVVPGPGECYGFVTPPAVGGTFDPSNVRTFAVERYLSACGRFHERIRDIPDGGRAGPDVFKPFA